MNLLFGHLFQSIRNAYAHGSFKDVEGEQIAKLSAHPKVKAVSRRTVIGIVGILNFFNAMMTSILARRREFAVLQAVGQTRQQLKAMLVWEGLLYTLGSGKRKPEESGLRIPKPLV